MMMAGDSDKDRLMAMPNTSAPDGMAFTLFDNIHDVREDVQVEAELFSAMLEPLDGHLHDAVKAGLEAMARRSPPGVVMVITDGDGLPTGLLLRQVLAELEGQRPPDVVYVSPGGHMDEPLGLGREALEEVFSGRPGPAFAEDFLRMMDRPNALDFMDRILTTSTREEVLAGRFHVRQNQAPKSAHRRHQPHRRRRKR